MIDFENGLFSKVVTSTFLLQENMQELTELHSFEGLYITHVQSLKLLILTSYLRNSSGFMLGLINIDEEKRKS